MSLDPGDEGWMDEGKLHPAGGHWRSHARGRRCTKVIASNNLLRNYVNAGFGVQELQRWRRPISSLQWFGQD
jgi:hypothetical protein